MQAQKERVLDKDPQGNEVVAGELLVTYKKGASKQAKENVPKKVGGKVEKDFPTIDVQHLYTMRRPGFPLTEPRSSFFVQKSLRKAPPARG